MPDIEKTHRHLPAYIWLLAILIIVGTLEYFLQDYFTLPVAQPDTATSGNAPGGFQQSAPAPAAADYVAAQHGFQYLVTYTDSGFHPTSLSIHKGETVRFTNNAATPLQISVDHAQSPELARGQYWEHTFSSTGTFEYDSASGSSGTVTVR